MNESKRAKRDRQPLWLLLQRDDHAETALVLYGAAKLCGWSYRGSRLPWRQKVAARGGVKTQSLATMLQVPIAAVRRALAKLSARGLLGWDRRSGRIDIESGGMLKRRHEDLKLAKRRGVFWGLCRLEKDVLERDELTARQKVLTGFAMHRAQLERNASLWKKSTPWRPTARVLACLLGCHLKTLARALSRLQGLGLVRAFRKRIRTFDFVHVVLSFASLSLSRQIEGGASPPDVASSKPPDPSDGLIPIPTNFLASLASEAFGHRHALGFSTWKRSAPTIHRASDEMRDAYARLGWN